MVNDVNDSFGKEAVTTLLKRMEDERGKFVVIVAGYTDNMNAFLLSNPGLKSRFDRTFLFADYSNEEMYKIALNMLAEDSIQPDDAAGEQIKKILTLLGQRKDKHFGNAREVRKLVEKVVKMQHLRLSKLPSDARTPEAIRTLTLQDVLDYDVNTPGEASHRIGFQSTSN